MSRSGALYASTAGTPSSVPQASGNYVGPPNVVTYGTVVNPPDAQARFCPFIVSGPASVAYTRIAMVTVTTAGASGAVTRLGIYRDTGGGRPGALVLDAGTVDTTVTPGALEIVITQTLNPGVYWLAAAPQGAPASHATTRSLATMTPGTWLTGATATTEGGWVGTAAYSGALPDPASGLSVTVSPFVVWLKVA